MPKAKVIEARPKKSKSHQHKSDSKSSEPQVPTSTIANRSLSKSAFTTNQFRDSDKMRPSKRRSHHRGDVHSSDLIAFFLSAGGSQRRWRLIMSVLGALCISVVFALIYHRVTLWRRANAVVSPINLPKIIPDSHDSDLFWGSYRPGLYFGLRQRKANSPLIGLIWTAQDINEPRYRHLCDSNDGILSYNWLEHDGRTFGTQQIVDKEHILTVSFIKRQSKTFGGDWSFRVSTASKTQTQQPTRPLSVIVYFYYPESNDTTDQQHVYKPIIKDDVLVGIQGNSSMIGGYELHLHSASDSLQNTFLLANTDSETEAMQTLYSGMGIHQNRPNLIALTGRPLARERDVAQKQPNIVFYETTVLPSELPSSAADSQDIDVVGKTVLEVEYFGSVHNSKPAQRLHGTAFTAELAKRSNAFHQNFAQRFTEPAQSVFSERQINLTKIALCNLLGGMGYYFGSSLIRATETGIDPVSNWEAALFTATPSRPMFPRGFLWDEGFHGLVLARWDPELAMQTVGHWLDLMNGDGWIPREQILGAESRSRVPDAFVVQSNTVANPPTLSLVIEALMDMLPRYTTTQASEFRQWALLTLPRLHAWYQWFNRTQPGQLPMSYRWRGRNPKEAFQLNPLTLSSGLDDYPRASHPSEAERHLDLRSWMAVFARIVGRLASLSAHYLQTGGAVSKTESSRYRTLEEARSLAVTYTQWADHLTDSTTLDNLHWSESAQRYADYGLHTDTVRFQTPDSNIPNPPKPARVVGRTPPSLQLITSQFGYVNLFPLLLRLLPATSPRLPRLLADLGDRQLLWSDYGLRSLAPSSPLYGQRNTADDPPYWRGAIWLNMNYLAVRSLRHYANAAVGSEVGDTAARLADSLAHNLARTVLGELERTGYLWEQYDEVRGKGQRAHPFAGWTTLISLVVAESPPKVNK